MNNACLVLENGEVFFGKSFGKSGEVFGEVVFNTSMMGYQEILSDPSYAGQLVTLTYPLIGNYGINEEDIESLKPHSRALIIRKLCNNYSNFRASMSLPDYLEKNNIIGIQGIDTRKLTFIIREKGAMRAGISSNGTDPDNLLKKVLNSPNIQEEDLVNDVSVKAEYIWDKSGEKSFNWPSKSFDTSKVSPFKIAVLDFGIKINILRLLRQYFSEVKVYPFDTDYNKILKYNPDGIFLSNGPGDPLRVKAGIYSVKNLLGKKPIFGICLGHQLLGLALGAKTFKLKFGHRGANQPVQAIHRKNIEITSQNHGFAVDIESLKNVGHNVVATHTNLNDNTSEGMKIDSLKAFSVQYHPESSPGPHDSMYLFDDFVKLISENK